MTTSTPQPTTRTAAARRPEQADRPERTGQAGRTAPAVAAAPAYVHGYSPAEARRLGDQADALAELLHLGTAYPPGSRVLEAGCGVGAQTVHLLTSGPDVLLTAADISADSLALARARVAAHAPGARVDWHHGDLHRLPFPDDSFDHLFVCFVLEHLADPAAALAALRRVLRPGGSVTVIEGDHGSALFHPHGEAAQRVVDLLVRLQADGGGDGLLGRRLYPLLTAAGFRDVVVGPRTMYADGSRPDLAEGFTRRTFIAMVEAVREDAVGAGLTTAEAFDRGVAELRRAAEPGGTFHYTFFKAVGVNP
ncbi:methyltransferase domain-containing protein [Kitasatospora sp. NPDC056327]|uniref:methyltransferase domain-containing protein n=1 Tax=Kitasatospora sp. NPDC056327 TaxID=3345785 RepID=UPI0035E2CC38